MGKAEDDVNLHAGGESSGDSTERNTRCDCCKWISSFVGFKCFFVLLLSVSVFLSALFLLLPFDVDRENSNLDPRFRGHEIVASFSINRPGSFLSENIVQLREDIFQEMSYISINVTILALEPLDDLNITKVVFGIDHDTDYREILPFSLSSVKEMFESVLISQSTLQLTKSLFGETFLFEVLKFPGGITVIPPQSAFPLQKFKIVFNFTLNYSINQIQVNFDTLASQLKNGLKLAPYENLYVSLSNSEGSTVSPPTTVHSSVLLRVGTSNSSPRLKQLTDTITGSRSRNLGLNNTIFGKVKQVRLSSFLPNNSDSSTKSPSPSPSPHSKHHHHHHHHLHHHHHHHHHNHHHHHHLSPNMAPEVPPVASPAPQRSLWKAPSAPPPCNLENRRGKRVHFKEKHVHISPTPAPAPSARPPYHQLHPRGPIPATRSRIVPISAPLPHVVFAHAAQPPKTIANEPHANEVGQPQPQSSSSANAGLLAMSWIVLPFLMLIVAGLHE